MAKVGSRRVIQVGAFIMIVFSVVGKFGTVFALLPRPVIGGIFWALFGLIISVGLSTLQHVNLNSSRNLFVLGFAFFNGMVVPSWVNQNSNSIQTGRQNN